MSECAGRRRAHLLGPERAAAARCAVTHGDVVAEHHLLALGAAAALDLLDVTAGSSRNDGRAPGVDDVEQLLAMRVDRVEVVEPDHALEAGAVEQLELARDP